MEVCEHDFEESYYGLRCKNCGCLIPDVPDEDDPDETSYGDDEE